MIHEISINSKVYPFHLGMRVIWHISNSGEIEYDEVDGKISSDYLSFLGLFEMANQSAVKRLKKGNLITVDELEVACDDNPKLFNDLQKVFEKSTVIEKLKQLEEEKGDAEKKPKG